MAKKSKYLLDANVFIEANQRYYPFALCPGFWDFLKIGYKRAEIRSVDRIKDELKKSKDDLSAWIGDAIPGTFFVSTSEKRVLDSYRQIVEWVGGEKQYFPAAKDKFYAGADGWLIAYALAHEYTVVTHEALAPEAKNRILIPNVCAEFEIECVNTFEMLTVLGAEFILKP